MACLAVALGSFVATFVYCLLVLRTIRRADEVAFVLGNRRTATQDNRRCANFTDDATMPLAGNNSLAYLTRRAR